MTTPSHELPPVASEDLVERMLDRLVWPVMEYGRTLRFASQGLRGNEFFRRSITRFVRAGTNRQ